MNDIKQLFEEDSKEKKEIARNALRRTTKPKMFLYENMSRKERKEYMAPSEITTFKLRPMSLKEFRQHSKEHQFELLKWYGAQYGWMPAVIADVLGCCAETGSNLLREHGLFERFKNYKRMAREEDAMMQETRRKKLKERTAGEVVTAEEPVVITFPTVEENRVERVKAPETPRYQKESTDAFFAIKLSGEMTGEELVRRLEAVKEMLLADRVYKATISIDQFAVLPRVKESEDDIMDA